MINITIELPDAKKLQIDELNNGDIQMTVWHRKSAMRWQVAETFILPQNRRELLAQNLWQQ